MILFILACNIEIETLLNIASLFVVLKNIFTKQ